MADMQSPAFFCFGWFKLKRSLAMYDECIQEKGEYERCAQTNDSSMATNTKHLKIAGPW